MSKSSFRDERLLSLLAEKGTLTVSDIEKVFRVSSPTVRRICSRLANEGKVMRLHGSIRFVPAIRGSYSFEEVEHEHNLEKRRIATYAAALIQDGQMIFLESGTTVRELAMSIAERLRAKAMKNVLFFTNSLTNLDILTPYSEVIMIGGKYRPNRRDFGGYISEKAIRDLHFDMVFLGADAINVREGIMASDIETVSFDEKLLARSDKSVVMAHSAKFKRNSLISYAAITDVSYIITDTDLPEETLTECREAGANIVRV